MNHVIHHLLFRKISLFLLVGTLLLSGCSTDQTDGNATPTPIPTPLVSTKPTYTVQRGDVTHQLDLSGRFVPVSQEDLYFRTSGRVDKVHVRKGDAVTEGQLLAKLDAGPNQFDLQRAQVNLEIAQLSLEQTKLQLPSDSPVYTNTLAIKEKEVELAQINLDELNLAAAAGEIVSPIAGNVLQISVLEGHPIEAFKPVISVANLADLEISAEVKRDELDLISTGMEVTVTPAVGTGSEAIGIVSGFPTPSGGAETPLAQGSPLVRVRLTVNPSQLGYELGDLVRLRMILDERDDVLWLPPQAIRNFETRLFVIVDDGGVQRRVDVKLGVKGNDRVEIVSGLTEGQVVIAP